MAVQDWFGIVQMTQCKWTCGHCGLIVANDKGFYKASEDKTPSNPRHPAPPRHQPLQQRDITESLLRIVICPGCERPTFFEKGKQMPGAAFGNDVAYLPAEIGELYREARNCMSVSAFTASVLALRKLLMNVAVFVGADKGATFQSYVEYLSANGYVPPKSKDWVDHIRKKGNEATHEIPSIGEEDAKDLLTFMEMVLKMIFEFPKRISSEPKDG